MAKPSLGGRAFFSSSLLSRLPPYLVPSYSRGQRLIPRLGLCLGGPIAVYLGVLVWSCSSQHAQPETAAIERRLARAPSEVRQDEPACTSLDNDRWSAYERGRRFLRSARPGAAITLLEAASLGGNCWATWNDLAVALHWRSQNGERPIDLVRALDAISTAARANDSRPAVLLNQARIASDLALIRTAKRSWTRFLERSSEQKKWEPERKLAREELAKLDSSTEQERWGDYMAGVNSKGAAPEEVLAIVAAQPYQARLFLEKEFFGRWADARLRNDGSEPRIISLGIEVSKALAETRGEQKLLQAVRSLENCIAGAASSPACLEGFTNYGRGVEVFYGGDRRGSEPYFAAAEELLGRAGSPLAEWASYFRIYATFDRDLAASERQLQALLAAQDEDTSPTLASRLHWRLGVALATRGESSSACQHFEKGIVLAQRASGKDGAVFGHILLAEEYEEIGDSSRAWRHRLQAAPSIVRSGIIRSIYSMLSEQVDALLRAGFGPAADAVADELLQHTRDAEPSDYTVGAWIGSGRARLAVGAVEKARIAFERADEHLKTRPDSDYRSVMEARLLAAKAQMPDQEPEQALALLERSVKTFATHKMDYELLPAMALRASMKIRLGKSAGALEDLNFGLAWLDRQQNRVDEMSRVYSLRTAQALVDRAVPLLLELGNIEAAVSMAENFRLRWLRGLVGKSETSASMVLSRLTRRIPLQDTLVYFLVLPKSTFAIVGNRRGIHTVELPVTEKALQGAVRRFESAVKTAPLRQALERSAELRDILFDPLGIDLTATNRIVFVPDRSLFRVPFAALFDRDRESFLIEETAVAISPTLNLFLRRGRAGGENGVAIVANPSTDPAMGIAPLPGAELEASRIAGFYPQARVVVGKEATPQRLLELLGSHRLLHYAGHAVADVDVPGRSRMLLAATASGNGSLFVEDAVADLDATLPTLIVLSACRTADGFRVDREGPLSFAAALFAAGAGAVVASLGDIDDEESPSLMATFHEQYAGGQSPAEAFRVAVRHELDSRGLGSFRSWSKFTVLERVESAHFGEKERTRDG